MRTASVLALALIFANYAFSGSRTSEHSHSLASPSRSGGRLLSPVYGNSSHFPGIGLRGRQSSIYGATPGGSSATWGSTYDSSYEYGGWSHVVDSVSVYKDGLLTRQAILSPVDSINPRSQLSEMELRLYSYDAAGRVQQIRALNHVFRSYDIVDVGDELTEFNYDDSGRVLNVVSSTKFGKSDWTPSMRLLYSYEEGFRLHSLQLEYFDGSAWVDYHRTSFFYYPSTLADSVVLKTWEDDQWLQDDTVEFVQPNPDTLIVRNGTGSHIDTLAFDSVSGTLRYSSEILPFDQTKTAFYAYSEDGLLTNVDSYLYTQGQLAEHMTYAGFARKGPSIFVLAPRNGDKSFNLDTIAVRFLGTGESLVNLEYAREGSNVWTTFASSLPDTGVDEYLWVPGSDVDNVKIRAAAGSVQSEMDGDISLRPGHQFVTQTTSSIHCGIFSTGFIGQDPQSPYPSGPHGDPGFRYKENPNVLFSGGIIVGRSGEPLFGNMASFYARMFSLKSPLTNFTSDASFDQQSECIISQGPPDSLEVTQQTASRMRDDFIFLTYGLKNLTTSALSQIYIGMFADWDINDLMANFGGIDSSRGLTYEYSPTGTDHNFYGIAALSGMSGAAVTSAPPDMSHMQSLHFPSGSAGADLRTFIGSGPFSIDPGGTQSVTFAILAATSLEGLRATADSARALWKGVLSAVAATPNVGPPPQFGLAQNYPNPFNPNTKIRFDIAGNVWTILKVYNVLGQEVRTLVNEMRQPGSYEVTFDANFLPSGVYFYRLEAGNYRQTRQLVLVR
jgi:hypothetical protein